MTDGVATLLVDVRVQALEIIVEDTFVTFHTPVELVGVSTSTEKCILMILGAVTIRERVKRTRIEDPFVVDEFVVFGMGSGAELVMFGIPVHAVDLDDGVTRGWS